MTNTEHIFELVRKWSNENNKPITKLDLSSMGISQYHINKAFNKLVKDGKLRRTVRGYGYVI